MSLEIEKNYHNINLDEVYKLLKKIKAKREIYLLSEYHYRNKKNNYRVRLRDSGNKITFTVKRRKKDDEFDTEWEIEISKLETAKEMLEIFGLNLVGPYEKIREVFYYKKSEIAIDNMVFGDPYLQIESPNEKELKAIEEKLKLNNKNNTPIDMIKFYGVNLKKFNKLMKSSLVFSDSDKLKKLITKQKTKFNKIMRMKKKLHKEVIKRKKKT